MELLFLLVYLKAPTPTYFPLYLPIGFQTYFYDNLSQFFIIMFIPYLPEYFFHIYDINIAMFLGLSIFWIPSILVFIWLVRQFFVRVLFVWNFKFYYAYIPILFTIFMPHTLLEIFTYNGSHFFSTLSEFFIMFISILSGLLFYYLGEKKFIVLATAAILLVNIQTFSFSFFLISLLLLIFSVFADKRGKVAFRSFLLIIIAVIASLVYLYASHPTVIFPYLNLSIPNIGPTDPNFRVFLASVFSKSRGIWNIFTMQNYVNDPYFPLHYSHYIYDAMLFFITSISLFPFLFFNKKIVKVGAPIYLSLIVLEFMNSFANPFISLIFPQNISIFYDLSFVTNSNLVFYIPLQMLAAISFLMSIISIPDFLRFINKRLHRFVSIDISIINHWIKKYWRPTLAILFAIIMVSPLAANITQSHISPNPVPYQNYKPFVVYFDNQKNASVYFDMSSHNQLLSSLQRNMYMIENPELVPDQTYPFTTAMSLLHSVKERAQPEYIDYLLSTFGYNFIVASNYSLSNSLINSGFFSMELNQSGVQVLKISKIVNQDKLVLLSSSVTSLINLVNDYSIFPQWIYSPYLLNQNYLKSIFSSNTAVYAPNYTTPQDLFSYVNGSSYLIPATYTSNSYYSTKWQIGYLLPYAQETWTQNIVSLKNYSYQSELNVNYGYIFTSTSNVSMKIHYTLPKGNYAILVDYLKSNIGGKFSISVSGNTKYVYTESSRSDFVTKYLGNYTSGGMTNVNITNIAGFNTIAYITFVPYSSYSAFLPVFNRYVNSSSVYSIYSYLGIQNVYNISITAPYSSNSLTYQQLLVLNLTEISSGINNNLSNILFTYPNGSPIYAFISSINTTHTADIWLRLSGEQDRVLRLFIFNKDVSFLGGYIGEPPGLSPVYGEYFNAPSVFGNSTSPNAWDWVSSTEGWINSGYYGYDVYAHDGIYVNGTLNGVNTTAGGIYLPDALSNGTSFNLYGWTKNSTVIQVGTFGFTGGNGYYFLQYYPNWTKNLSVPEKSGLFYNFTLDILANSTVTAYINGTRYKYSSDSYPINDGSTLWLREVTNNPQYYQYAFIRTLPINGIMPHVYIYKENILEG